MSNRQASGDARDIEVQRENDAPETYPLTNNTGNSSGQRRRKASTVSSSSSSSSSSEHFFYECAHMVYRCIHKRTYLERYLIILLVAALLAIVFLALALGRLKTIVTVPYCNSSDCINVASSILNTMDQTASPCDDFYRYACGGWVKDTPIPPGFSLWDRFQELSSTNILQLKYLIDKMVAKNPSSRKARQFYQSCMIEGRESRNYTLQKFFDLIDSITNTGPFPSMLEAVHSLNVWPIFSITIGPGDGEKNTIKIENGDVPYPFWSVYNSTVDQSTMTRSKRHNPVVVPTGPKYLKWTEKEVSEKYMQDTTRVLRIFWNKTNDEAEVLAENLMILEQKIAMSMGSGHSHNGSTMDVVMTIEELQRKCPMIGWARHFSNVLNRTDIDPSQNVTILHEKGFLHSCNVIKDYKNNNPDLLQMSLVVHLVRSMIPVFDARTFDEIPHSSGVSDDEEQWRRCVFYTNKAFGMVTGALYVNKTVNRAQFMKIKELVGNVKQAFKEHILNKHWLDERTKSKAAQKISGMLEKISYPDNMLTQSALDDYYKSFDVSDDWFTNIKNMNIFIVNKMTEILGDPVDRQRWIKSPVTVNVDYSPVRNDIVFPIAMFHVPFYAADGPQAYNYGALGSIIGHQITHAFNIVGLQDTSINITSEWDPWVNKYFQKRIGCMKKQYDGYKLDSLQINGEKTLAENIADNGGLRAAYMAYQMWERDQEEKYPFPGVSLSNKQLFFISYAQMFCSKWSKSGLRRHIIDKGHSPGPVRVLGVISNFNVFGDLFSCPRVSKFNPATKCEVW